MEKLTKDNIRDGLIVYYHGWAARDNERVIRQEADGRWSVSRTDNGKRMVTVHADRIHQGGYTLKPDQVAPAPRVQKPPPEVTLPNKYGRPTRETIIPEDSAERKKYPLFSGLMAYFPDALAEVAHLSWAANEKHNPGEPMHWSDKSPDHADTLLRHQARIGTSDSDGIRHAVKVAWRALAQLQEELTGTPGK